MSLVWLLQLLSLGVVLNADICGGEATTCNPAYTWFGTACRYKCRCINNNCDSNGECTNSSECENGWFGPSCQYANLVTTNRAPSTPYWVYDFPDTQCNQGQENPVTVSLNETFYFTWLRLRSNVQVSSQNINLQLMYANGTTVDCSNPYTSRVSDTILDIHCQPGALFQNLTLTGKGVTSLCSVYISGGRNVALRQVTVQSSDYSEGNFKYISQLAVDGNNNSDFKGNSCTHTKNENRPSWTLTFDQPHHINRYVIYNRNSLQDRLSGFFLGAYQENSSLAFKYTGPSTSIVDIYRFQSLPPLIPVSKVTVIATKSSSANEVFLTLCEVEMFGDAVCPELKYGRECNFTCNCANGENCPVSTGGCPSGCAAGYQGEGCRSPCNKTYFGTSCTQDCNTTCKDEDCQPSNGTCLSCIPGKEGSLCDRDCNSTFWGENCANNCSVNCKDKLCNVINGSCLSCAAGKFGENCSKDCDQKFYGENCAMPCSTNCANQLCNPINGSCQSCVNGTSGLLCDKACPPTTFGGNCSETCSINCTNQLCNTFNGKCGSCVQGSAGEYCDQMMLVQPPDRTPPVAAIVGPVVAFVVLAALIVVGIIFWRRRRHNKNEYGETAAQGFHNNAEFNNIHIGESNSGTKKPIQAVTGQVKAPVMTKPNSSRDNDDSKMNHVNSVYYNQVPGRSETAIRFDELDNFMSTHGKEFFQQQFNSIPANSSATTTTALSPENVNKNRYKNINAYDDSRVHLQSDVLKNHGDYINASYIDGYQRKKQFIASQGATKIILEDFIRMLWEQEIEVVVMLTNLVEDGKLKCEQYWPNDGEINIGEVTVKLTTTQVFADYTIRRLCLYKKASHVQVLTHFHFTTWPDKDVPTTAWGLVDLEQRVASISTSKPIVVHCSAGVGRTGTFIALHNILEEIKHTRYMDVFTTVQKLRQDRINMVQTSPQYEFLHRATQIAKVCKGTTVTTGNIRDKIQALELSESGQSNLEKEFKSVCMVCSDDEYKEDEEQVQENNTYCNSRLITNITKNRLNNVLPKEDYRPVLKSEIEELGNYINAVLIPSCEKHDHQILTQLPLPTTVIDFWRLVIQYKVSLIVAFERDLSTVDTTIGDYLPEAEGETKTCSFLNIKTTELDSSDTWDLHRITISVNEEHGSKMATKPLKGEYRLSHLSWKNKDFGPKNLLILMEKIRSMKPVGEGRTLFTCRNGAELSGLACTMSLLLDRMDNDQHISVPLVVGTLKAIRPQIIPTLNQYRLLYQTLNLFNETNNEYSNFSASQSSTTRT